MGVSKKEVPECSVDAALAVLDGRWKGTILWKLVDGPMRPGELRRSMAGITERVLLRQLQELTVDGILERRQDGGAVPATFYSISAYGTTLLPAVEALCVWGRVHMARARGDVAKDVYGARRVEERVGDA